MDIVQIANGKKLAVGSDAWLVTGEDRHPTLQRVRVCDGNGKRVSVDGVPECGKDKASVPIENVFATPEEAVNGRVQRIQRNAESNIAKARRLLDGLAVR